MFTVSTESTDSNYNGLTVNVSVKVIDSDVPRVVPSTSQLTVAEGGSSTFEVRLSQSPSRRHKPFAFVKQQSGNNAQRHVPDRQQQRPQQH